MGNCQCLEGMNGFIAKGNVAREFGPSQTSTITQAPTNTDSQNVKGLFEKQGGTVSSVVSESLPTPLTLPRVLSRQASLKEETKCDGVLEFSSKVEAVINPGAPSDDPRGAVSAAHVAEHSKDLNVSSHIAECSNDLGSSYHRELERFLTSSSVPSALPIESPASEVMHEVSPHEQLPSSCLVACSPLHEGSSNNAQEKSKKGDANIKCRLIVTDSSPLHEVSPHEQLPSSCLVACSSLHDDSNNLQENSEKRDGCIKSRSIVTGCPPLHDATSNNAQKKRRKNDPCIKSRSVLTGSSPRHESTAQRMHKKSGIRSRFRSFVTGSSETRVRDYFSTQVCGLGGRKTCDRSREVAERRSS